MYPKRSEIIIMISALKVLVKKKIGGEWLAKGI